MKLAFVTLMFSLCVGLSASGQDWTTQVRQSVDQKDLATAQRIVNQRLAAAPADWEALGWHARILSWQGEWSKAEAEYQQVLQHAPDDADILLALADVLYWQRKYQPILRLLDRATSAGAPAAEVMKRRARVLTALGRPAEAKNAYQEWLAIDPNNREARDALSTTTAETRHELRIGSDTDFFNYTDTANAESLTLRSRWNSRWTTLFGGSFYQRFGSDARKFNSAVTANLGAHDYLTIGGAVANRQDVISRYDQTVAYGHAFDIRNVLVRGLETSIEERSLWFSTSQATLFGGTALVYLPRDLQWSFSAYGVRSHFDIGGNSWNPSGMTRLAFPIQHSVRGNVFYAVGSEDYSSVDQIGRFSARTFGGGLRFQLTSSQDITAYGAYQDRSQGRSQTSMGLSYGIRF